MGLSLIVAIGSQNAFVLRQGLARQHVFTVVLTCALSDALLILVGVFAFQHIAAALPAIVPFMRGAGALYLTAFGGLCFYHAPQRHHPALNPTASSTQSQLKALLQCLAFTWLNPHVYLDTVVLIGSVATSFPHHPWAFAIGAMTASFVFFVTLGTTSRLLSPVLATPRAWRILDALIGSIMLAIAAHLIMPLL